MKATILLILLAFSTTSFASEKYEYCEYLGVSIGADENFMTQIIFRIMEKENVDSQSEICLRLRRDGKRFSEEFSTGELFDKNSVDRWLKYQNFRDSIYDSIVENINY
ncbi:hypothetical protein tloyanaT_26020 [Thalassotalea loyana]|uniref:DUF3718 domain-containing protein n=1 Tax=Thalassotalea loyana TaxID=280483 RepID=A0ABQ6HFI8_9GAMM|nr:hypothetical protein [Thalassotalea loyana]GLX86349.1 hypothetical protein tloyanaT_26020 [Thalassotalea loyana]